MAPACVRWCKLCLNDTNQDYFKLDETSAEELRQCESTGASSFKPSLNMSLLLWSSRMSQLYDGPNPSRDGRVEF